MTTISRADIRTAVAMFLLLQTTVWYAVALNFAAVGAWTLTAMGAAGGTITFAISERLRRQDF